MWCPLLPLLLPGVIALDNGQLRTPPLGFSDACLGGGESTRLGAVQLQEVATAFLHSGLAALGYTHMNLGERQATAQRPPHPRAPTPPPCRGRMRTVQTTAGSCSTAQLVAGCSPTHTSSPPACARCATGCMRAT